MQTANQNGQNGHDAAQDRACQIAELGAKLRALREAQKITIADISDDTKIQQKYLTAIEAGQIDSLPKGPYKRSFIRQYCEYLSADDMWKAYDSLTESFKGQTFDKTSIKKANEEGGAIERERTVFKSKNNIWIYAVVILALAAAAWITVSSRDRIKKAATNPIAGGTAAIAIQDRLNAISADIQKAQPVRPQAPAVSADAVSADARSADAAQTVMSADVSSDAAARGILKITALQRIVWIRVSVAGKNIFQGDLAKDEVREFEVSGDVPLRVRFGSPAYTKAEWAGNTYDPVQPGWQPRTRYYWSDGTVTYSPRRQVKN